MTHIGNLSFRISNNLIFVSQYKNAESSDVIRHCSLSIKNLYISIENRRIIVFSMYSGDTQRERTFTANSDENAIKILTAISNKMPDDI